MSETGNIGGTPELSGSEVPTKSTTDGSQDVPAAEHAKVVDALRRLTEAAHSTLCESNGVHDNGWRRPGEVEFNWEVECPIASFASAIELLDQGYSAALRVLEPIEAAKRLRWENACATASAIVDIFKAGGWNPASGLHRNIADAINGTFVVTAEDRRAGKPMPETMRDKLASLVASGDLVEAGAVIRDPSPGAHDAPRSDST